MSLSPIIFYSKYSSFCERFFSLLQYGEIDLKKIYKIEAICIDNTELRKKLLDYKKVQIRYTPTMLIFLNDGNVEKYEGEYCIQWAINEVKKINPNAYDNTPKKQIDNDPPKKAKKSSKKAQKIKPKIIEKKQIELVDDENTEGNIGDIETNEETEGHSDISDLMDLSEIEDENNEDDKNVAPIGKNGKVNVSQIMAAANARQSKMEQAEKRPMARPPINGHRM